MQEKLDLKNRGPIEMSAFGKDTAKKISGLNREVKSIKRSMQNNTKSFVQGAQ